MIIKMRKKGEKEWDEREVTHMYGDEDDPLDEDDIIDEVHCYAEEWGMKISDTIEVYRRGKYRICNMWEEVQYEAEKI